MRNLIKSFFADLLWPPPLLPDEKPKSVEAVSDESVSTTNSYPTQEPTHSTLTTQDSTETGFVFVDKPTQCYLSTSGPAVSNWNYQEVVWH